MSLSATLATAMSGLSTAQRALGVTAHNVANANTAGYSRKVVSQEAVVVNDRGSGARALDAERVVDEFLTSELRAQRSRLGRSEALVRYHDRIQETLFGAPGDGNRGVTNRIGRLAEAAEALATTPEKGAHRVAFIAAAQDLIRQLADDAGRVQQLRADADREIKLTVDAINADIRALHQLNGEVARSRAPAELLDRRDNILQSLAEKLPVSVVRHEDGRLAIYTQGGQALLEYEANQLDYQAAAQVGAATGFGPIRLFRSSEMDSASGTPLPGAAGVVLVSGGLRAALTPELRADEIPDAGQAISSPFTGGRLQGLIEARDRVLPELGDQLGELASLVRYTLNAAHNDAVPHPPPRHLSGTRTDLTGWDGAANAGTAYLAVVDRATGVTVTSFGVEVGVESPEALLAQINAGLGGLGEAVLDASGALEITLGAGGHGITLAEGDSRIVVRDAAGHGWSYGLAHYFGLNDLVVATGPGSMDLAVRPDILADSGRLSAVALAVEPGPPVMARAGGAGDSRPAQALAAAMQRGIDTVSRGAMAGRRASVGEYAADLVALAAVQADQVKNQGANDQALVDDLAFRQGSVSGVNLDEELSRLVLYQQAYSVSARIVSITDRLFDELLSIGR